MAIRPQDPEPKTARAGARSSRRHCFPLLGVTLLALAPSASAQITTMEEAPSALEVSEPLPFFTFGLMGYGSFNTYGMQEANEAIEVMNNRWITAPGVRFDEFSKGASIGGGVRVILAERFPIEIVWERLIASQEIGGRSKSELSVGADAYVFAAGYDMMKKPRVAFGPSIGVGWYDVTGEQSLHETNASEEEITVATLDMSGSALGVNAGVYFETALYDHVWMNAFAGYRSAKVSDVEVAGLEGWVAAFEERRQVLTRQIGVPFATCEGCPDVETNGTGDDIPDGIPDMVIDGSKITFQDGGSELDWSGFRGRLALTWYFNAPVE